MQRPSMKTLCIAACCVLSLARCALAANPTWTLHPDEPEKLKKWGLQVSYQQVVNDFENPEYAFTITANLPEGINALDAWMSIGNGNGLVTRQSWSDSDGKCVAFFTIGKQALKDAGFMVQLYHGQRTDPFSASGRYVFSLAEFASDERYLTGRAGITNPSKTTEFRTGAPIRRDGRWLTVEVTPKDVLNNFEYDVHVVVQDRSDQHFEICNGRPITKSDVRLADLTADGFLDIMIAAGPDHRGQDWYKTLIYDKDKSRYRWITEETGKTD